jgi:outer membrane receptor protein involved in Fe transport
MQIFSIKRSLYIILFLFSGFAFAQDKPLGTETVIVVKPYTPSVNDAFKIKETPTAGDSVSLEKKPVKYSIFSVPVASTFTPSKGTATRVEKAKRIKLYDNYVTLGFGTYSNALAEFYTNFEVNRSDNFGIYLNHNSTQGGIKGVRLEDKFYDTELNLDYSSRNKKSSWSTELGLQHQLFNWYGLPEGMNFSDAQVANIDPQQNYYSAFAGAKLELYESFFERASAGYRYFGDAFNSAEHRFKTDAFFEVNIADELINTTITADIVNGQFDRSLPGNPMLENNYSFVNMGIAPSLLILRDDLTLNLGLAFYYSLNTENSKNSFYIYPQVTASYRLGGEYFIPYAGLEGNLKQNSYYEFAQENPYVAPGLDVQPTDMPYDAYLGAKGKLTNFVSYNLRGSYKNEFNKPLFLTNFNYVTQNEGYSFGNSFGTVYDDINTLSIFGEVNIDIKRNFRLGLNAAFFSYNSETEAEAWNLPDYKASILADYQISEKWYAGANIFFMGERKDMEAVSRVANSNNSRMVTLDSYVDLNANLGYRFNNQLSIFLRGANLLGENYERWSNYPVQGIQALAGATYKFDF